MVSLMKRTKGKARMLLWIGLIVAGIGLVAYRIAFPKPEPRTPSVAAIRAEKGLPVRVRTVTSGTWELRRSYYGQVAASATQEVTAVLRERILRVLVEEGQRVRAGQPLLVLESTEQAANLGADRAAVEEARRDYRRAKVLVQEGGLSRADVDKAYVRLRAEEAKLAASRSTLGQTTVRAAVDGVVAVRDAEPGEVAEPGKLLLSVLDPSRLEAQIPLPSSELGQVRPGTEVAFSLEGRTLNGRVKRVNPKADPATGLFTAVVALPPDRGVRPGVFLEGQFLIRRKEGVIALPSTVFLREGDQMAVYLVSGDRAVRRPVKVGEGQGDTLEVLSGLAPGDAVVEEGVGTLSDGAKLWIQDPASRDRTPSPATSPEPRSSRPAEGEGAPWA